MGSIEPAAATAATLLARGSLVGGEELAAPELAALVNARLPNHPDLRSALEQARAQPEDRGPVGALAQALTRMGEQDPAFGRQLAVLVAHARQASGLGGLVTQVYGHAQVGELVTIGQAGDIHLHLPPAPAPTVLERLRRGRPGVLVANLPARNLVFTGREHLLDRLHATLRPGQLAAVVQAQALHGLGGVGKSQLAVEYAHRHLGEYGLIWWVAAEQPLAVPGQLVALARRLGIPEAAEQAETIQALWDELRQFDRWLLIFDNADDSRGLRPYWPPSNGQVLVTSRNPAWASLAATARVDVLPRGEAVMFMRRRAGLDAKAAEALAEALGDLPLALEQAAAYLDETAISAGEYLELLGERASQLYALGTPSSSEETIATTWTVSLQRIRGQVPVAEDLLTLCAFLAPDDIPRALLPNHPDALPERLATVVCDRVAYQQAIAALHRYSLTTVSGDALSVHRLVQAVIRKELSLEQTMTWTGTAIRLFRASFPDDSYEIRTWPECGRLLPHALTAADHADAVGVEREATGWVLNRVGVYLQRQAEYSQAKQLYGRALGMYEAACGPTHPEVARSLGDLGTLLYELGDFRGAREAHERAAAIYQAAYGLDDPNVARNLTRLGRVLRRLGDLPAARDALARALPIRETRLGADHPETATTLNDLGVVLRDLADLPAARDLLKRALAIRKTRLGADHPDTAQSLSSLATVLHVQGDLDHARTLLERALAIDEAHLSPDHPETAKCLHNLGLVLRDQGDLDAARDTLERALAIREARLGADHFHVAATLTNLATIRYNQGDLDAARRLQERALAIREARLGADHPDTVRSRQNLAAVVAALDNQQ
jgi:tetratricopeptide (TPR) repeat protein